MLRSRLRLVPADALGCAASGWVPLVGTGENFLYSVKAPGWRRARRGHHVLVVGSSELHRLAVVVDLAVPPLCPFGAGAAVTRGVSPAVQPLGLDVTGSRARPSTSSYRHILFPS
jgi:hypothetical protein